MSSAQEKYRSYYHFPKALDAYKLCDPERVSQPSTIQSFRNKSVGHRNSAMFNFQHNFENPGKKAFQSSLKKLGFWWFLLIDFGELFSQVADAMQGHHAATVMCIVVFLSTWITNGYINSDCNQLRIQSLASSSMSIFRTHYIHTINEDVTDTCDISITEEEFLDF